ncbi:hypothetical protein RPYSC3_07910 [Rhodopseudomonas palustris]|nr:hypothetical protein RPYSC3_07910 [Rhodopseudomonas palustris]
MPGLDPGIHDRQRSRLLPWMAGSSPAMTSRLGSGRAEHDRRVSNASYGAIDTGEKSTNQLFGCTKPLIFGLSARGPTSWAT